MSCRNILKSCKILDAYVFTANPSPPPPKVSIYISVRHVISHIVTSWIIKEDHRLHSLATSCTVRGRGQLKCDGTRSENRFRLSAKRTSHLNRSGRQLSRLLATEVCASAVVMLDKPCSEVVRRVLATHSIRQFPLHFPFRASPCAITFELESTQSEPAVSHL